MVPLADGDDYQTSIRMISARAGTRHIRISSRDHSPRTNDLSLHFGRDGLPRQLRHQGREQG
jgi:hypothetical protein